MLEADYSVALTLLLKYPMPKAGPQSFVEDALYLRDQLNSTAGATIISKYSGRTPSYSSNSRPMTPNGPIGLSPEQKGSARRSPLPSPARFLQQQGGVEALLQGAVKGALERGERLGINRAVQGAVNEVKKNMQGLSQSPSSLGRRSSDMIRWSLDEGRAVSSPRRNIVALEQRNKSLARMLDEALGDLRKISSLEEVTVSRSTEAIDIAIAKVQFVQVYLEDSTMPLPSEMPENVIAEASEKLLPNQSAPKLVHRQQSQARDGASSIDASQPATRPVDSKSSQNEEVTKAPSESLSSTSNVLPTIATGTDNLHVNIKPREDRPQAPVPTRSSLAQSSFAWMLEPDAPSSSTPSSTSPKQSSPFLTSGRKPGTGPKREKTAFLFGDDPEETIYQSRKPSMPQDSEDGFNLEAMKGGKSA